MKRKTLFVLASTFAFNVQAQSWDTGADIVSSYVWRGTKFGTGPAMQPWAEYSTGGFAIGAWGSYGFTDDEAAEADLYASYGFDLGEGAALTLTVTDYYFPGSMYFDGDSHFFEPMIGLELGSFSFTGAYMTGDGVSDTYLEAGLAVGSVNLALGAGDGAYTMDGDFNVCNISVGTSKEIKITDTFSLPISGTAILNPSSEQFHIVVGISL
ncbi:TorF family putative porin [Sunxiuqinia dokdonensis]|uniref:Outer membrane protein beta-barrel domain-containing protein n=1 Tax=Sunxiuqinia dokdonensis TaxID=1409788 RepID=A0A0L8VEQ1_9BACT|nr:hypothetical protein [Sunxiuqinia dokdonensis]KOH46955.1 hypothetical protein NC99_02340 [Sunxiuqinia dokdonensis]